MCKSVCVFVCVCVCVCERERERNSTAVPLNGAIMLSLNFDPPNRLEQLSIKSLGDDGTRANDHQMSSWVLLLQSFVGWTDLCVWSDK